MEIPFYYPGLTRQIAETLLKTRAREGTYLIRDCKSSSGLYILSLL